MLHYNNGFTYLSDLVISISVIILILIINITIIIKEYDLFAIYSYL